jgi:hypothetical protein
MNEKYPEMKEKFGMWRAHQHFDIQDNECFVETTDKTTKESTLKIAKKTELTGEVMGTRWVLTAEGPVAKQYCYSQCKQ